MRHARFCLLISLGIASPLLATAAAGKTPAPPETRISLDFKDADILDVVRLMSEVGSFQVVVDPGVACKLTLKLKEVPWDAALDVALRSCGLGHEEESGIVRVAPVARLTEEAAARRRLLPIVGPRSAGGAGATGGLPRGAVPVRGAGVSVQRASETGAEEALPNLPFLPGDRVWTDQGGRAEIQFADGTVLRIDSR